jgi:hypothetical protein
MFARAALIICALAIPTAALADDGVGFSIGRAYVVVDDEEDNDLSFKVYGEYGIFPGLAMGLAYHVLGRTEFCTGCVDAGGYFETSVISLSMGYTWSVARMQLSARVGYAYWYQDGEIDTRGNDIIYGLAVGVSVTRGLSVRAEWEPFVLSPGCEAEMVSVGLHLTLRT